MKGWNSVKKVENVLMRRRKKILFERKDSGHLHGLLQKQRTEMIGKQNGGGKKLRK